MQTPVETYHARRKFFSDYGVERFLDYLQACDSHERSEGAAPRLGIEAEGFNILLHTLASADVDTLPAGRCKAEGHGPGECYGCVEPADAILNLPGFSLTAAIGEPVLRAYIFHVFEHLGFGWCDKRHEMADLLIAMYKRRGMTVPREWTQAKLDSWFDG